MSPCGLGGGQTSTGGPLTDFRRRRRNPSASSGQVLPLPQARGGLAGCGSTRAHSTGSGQALRRTPARLTMHGGYEYVGSGWWEVGVTLVRWDCWVLLGPGRGRRDDGGHGGREAGVERGLGCVHSVGRMCSVSGGCVHFGGRCVQFSAVRLGWGWGMEGRRDSSAPLRCARNDNSGGGGALGMRAWTGWQVALGLIMALGPG